MTFYDAIIVDGGPAGGAAAYHLAAGGARVVLLERSAYPRDKACGDLLSNLAVRSLEKMGLGEFLLQRSPREKWHALFGDAEGNAYHRMFETRREGNDLALEKRTGS